MCTMHRHALRFPPAPNWAATRTTTPLTTVTHRTAEVHPGRFAGSLRWLGRAHGKFHAPPAQYDVVRAALMDSLRAFAGEQWLPEYDQAWRDAYDVIARRMIQGAEEDSHNPPYWHAEVLT